MSFPLSYLQRIDRADLLEATIQIVLADPRRLATDLHELTPTIQHTSLIVHGIAMLGSAPGLFDMVDGILKPFGHLIFGAGDQTSSEAGEAHGDLRRVNHHPCDGGFV